MNHGQLRKQLYVLASSRTVKTSKRTARNSSLYRGEHDQYLVRVAGTGRLTLRNRRFLRRFQEESSTPNMPMLQTVSRPVTRLVSNTEGSPSANVTRSSDDNQPAETDWVSTPEHEVSKPLHTAQTPRKSVGRPYGPSKKT